MKIEFMSAWELKNLYRPNPKVLQSLIRIGDTADEFFPLRGEEIYHDILTLTFLDYDGESERIGAFGHKESGQIKAFLNRNKHVQKMIVHCKEGISRSSAVALYIARIMGESEVEKSIVEDDYFHPNKRVLTFLEQLDHTSF